MKITTQKQELDFDFQGIKIIDVENTTLFIKEFILNKESQIEINNRTIKKENIILIDDLTKVNDFLKLNKNSKITEILSQRILDLPFVDNNKKEEIANYINSDLNINVLQTSQGDSLKMINLFFEIIDLGYLDPKKLAFLVEKILIDQNYLIVFNNLSWIRINHLTKYLNLQNFLIVTDDFRTYLEKINNLELICLYNGKNFFEILDWEKTCSYLELKLNTKISHDFLTKIKNDLFAVESLSFLSLIKKLN